MNLKRTITNIHTKNGKRFDVFIQILIILSLISFSLETLPNLSALQARLLYYFEVFCVVVFTIEYLLRIYYNNRPWKYIFSFYGIIDLLAILPFFVTVGLDLRTLRVFRIFRVFRVFKLVRYNQALNRFKHAAIESKEEIILFILVTGILIYLSAVGIYYFEHEAQPQKFSSVFSSLWWSIATLTTVGYGDVYPITIGGKIFTFFILIIGLGIITVPAGLVASALLKSTSNGDEG